MVETQSPFDKEYRVCIGKYQVVKQPCVCSGKGQRNSVLMLNTSFYELRDECGIIWWIAEHTPKPRLFQTSLSAINAENQQIIKQTPNFTPKNVKLGVFILFKTNHIRSENNLIKNRTNEKNNQFIFRKISYLCSK